MKEQKRQQPCDFFPFFHQRNTVTEPLGGFSLQLRGLFELDLLLIEMNRPNITAPYNSILGTDGRVIREDTFPNPQSSHVLWHSDVEKGRKRTAETDDPSGPHTYTQMYACTHTHRHAWSFIQEAAVTLGCGSNWFHGGQENAIKNNRKVWWRVFS